jgi:hypothetical protein
MSQQQHTQAYLFGAEEDGTVKRKRGGLLAALAVLVALALAAGGFYLYAKRTCGKALELADALEFQQASETFRGIPLNEKLFSIESEYIAAGELTAKGDYEAAAGAFKALGIYREAPAALKQTRYLQAAQVLENGEYINAAERFAALGDYRDSADRAFEAKMMRADALADGGNYESAKELLVVLADEGYEKARKALVDAYKQCAADYAEKGQYSKAYKEILELQSEQGADVDTLLGRYRKKAYESAVSSYRNLDYAAAKTQLLAIGDYDEAEDYLFLIEVHNQTSWSISQAAVATERLKTLILKEDAADLLMSDSELAEQFLLGDWEGSGYYLSMGADSFLAYDLPHIDYGDYYYIQNGVVLLYEEDNAYATKELFFIRVITVNCIQVYAYQDGQTYTLFRS